jgi:RNA polymerase sigma-70 factor (ECF subfamily)
MKYMASPGASPAQIEEIYRKRFQAFLLGVTAFVRDGDLALDVVQEGFALALRRRATFRGEGNLEAWLWRIVLNVARDTLRFRRRQAAAPQLEPIEVSDERDDDLRALLLGLPERQRLAVFLRYYADLPYEEIAEALDISPGTVAASLNAARRALRRTYEEVNK